MKTAAIRKLEQELGIPQTGKGSVPRDSFKFLTRIYYRSIVDDPKWGEHESTFWCGRFPMWQLTTSPGMGGWEEEGASVD